MVRRLTHVPDFEGSSPTGYSYFRHHLLNYIFFSYYIVSCLLVSILFLVYHNLMDN